MVQSLITHPEFPITEDLITSEENMCDVLILLPIVVDVLRVADPMVEVVHVDFIMLLSWMVQSLSVESEHAEFVT